jgi:hypothetical protein
MNGELRIFPQLGYVVVSLSNLDPPAASELVEFFTLRMPDQSPHSTRQTLGPRRQQLLPARNRPVW